MEAQYEPHDRTKENTCPPLTWSFWEDFFFLTGIIALCFLSHIQDKYLKYL